MRLLDLEPEWVADYNPVDRSRRVDESLTIATAQGVMFLCPKCFQKHGGAVGTHSILAWFKSRGVPDDADPGPGRWGASGTGFADLTLDPSIDLTQPPRGSPPGTPGRPDEWHGHVQNGQIVGGI